MTTILESDKAWPPGLSLMIRKSDPKDWSTLYSLHPLIVPSSRTNPVLSDFSKYLLSTQRVYFTIVRRLYGLLLQLPTFKESFTMQAKRVLLQKRGKTPKIHIVDGISRG
eukprot:TRINITY_DN13294_c1_g1_i1.p1 TRINITY_DN13294_c1_g1~~TRINITY_DN13294_c1_g1_i1.p1  ORF type:complete len:110 (-),score=6.52 TRINITY_DN13294_c1_g1_i1:43-372(-)